MKSLAPIMTPDQFFADLVHSIHGWGSWEDNHTEVKALSAFMASYKTPVSLQNFPILTLKKVNVIPALKELIWYIKGDHHIREFREHSKIWNQWADENGHLESAYGRYWRYYPHAWDHAMVGTPQEDKFYTPEGEAFASIYHPCCVKAYDGRLAFDQLKYLVMKLKEFKADSKARSRRLVMYAYYPPNAAVSKLPPCHHTVTLMTQEKITDSGTQKVLNLHLNQRSLDLGLGYSFNQLAYCVLLLLLCQECGYTPGFFGHTATDAHIYADHLQPLIECTNLVQHPFPSITLPKKSLFDLDYEDAYDFKLSQYKHNDFVPLTCHT